MQNIITIIIIIVMEKNPKQTSQPTKTQTVPRAITINNTGKKWALQMHYCPSVWVGGQRKNEASENINMGPNQQIADSC